MKKISIICVATVALIVLVFLSFSFTRIDEGEIKSVKTHSGLRIFTPGLHFILPWQSVKTFRINQQLAEFELLLPQSGQNLQIKVLWDVDPIGDFIKTDNNSTSVNNLINVEVKNLLVTQMTSQAINPATLQITLLQSLQNDSKLNQAGIVIKQLWITNIVPDAAMQAKIFTNMKSLATTISQDIVKNGTLQASVVRNQAEQNFLQAQSQALKNVAEILGQGNQAAIKIIAPLYQQNPKLFNAYVAEKVKLLSAQS